MDIQQLKKEVQDLKDWKASLESSSTIPLNVDQSFRSRLGLTSFSAGLNALLTLTGVLRGSAGTFSATAPLSGVKVYFVADSSGGAVTRKLTFNGGVLTLET